MAAAVDNYLGRLKIKHKLTSAFHPRTNGKVERLNGVLKQMLRKFVQGAIHCWDQFIEPALLACRIRKHRVTGYSPFYLVYGQHPVIPGDPLRPFVDSAVARDPRTIAEHTSQELIKHNQARAAAEARMRAASAQEVI